VKLLPERVQSGFADQSSARTMNEAADMIGVTRPPPTCWTEQEKGAPHAIQP
jgi:hypothetical protein